MKKRYMAVAIIAVATLGGCVIKAPTLPGISTGENISGGVMTGTVITGAETGTLPTGEVVVGAVLTGPFDSGVVQVVTGSEGVNANTGVTAEVTQLIDERKTQTGDQNKLTEEDIGLIEKVIEKMKSL